jgi:hypothetical protein
MLQLSMAVRAKNEIRTYIFVIDTDPRASRSKDNTSLHVPGQVREPLKYFGIICRNGSESDCTRPDEWPLA